MKWRAMKKDGIYIHTIKHSHDTSNGHEILKRGRDWGLEVVVGKYREN